LGGIENVTDHIKNWLSKDSPIIFTLAAVFAQLTAVYLYFTMGCPFSFGEYGYGWRNRNRTTCNPNPKSNPSRLALGLWLQVVQF